MFKFYPAHLIALISCLVLLFGCASSGGVSEPMYYSYNVLDTIKIPKNTCGDLAYADTVRMIELFGVEKVATSKVLYDQVYEKYTLGRDRYYDLIARVNRARGDLNRLRKLDRLNRNEPSIDNVTIYFIEIEASLELCNPQKAFFIISKAEKELN